jgi:hypothetical protein
MERVACGMAAARTADKLRNPHLLLVQGLDKLPAPGARTIAVGALGDAQRVEF